MQILNRLFPKTGFSRFIFFQFFPVFCLALLPFWAAATHIIGGELTYKFVQEVSPGINRYQFSMVVYRNCNSANGSTLDGPAYMALYKGTALSATFVSKTNATLVGPVPVQPVVPPCADASQVSNICVEFGSYTFTLDLAVDAVNSYFIVYQRCCRTNQIVNVNNPGSFGSTYMVEIPPVAQLAKNSSPTFASYPPTFICQGFAVNFDHSATDFDGDSLVYSFCNPLAGGGQGGGGGAGCGSPQPNPPCGPPFAEVPFSTPFTALDPMGGNPQISIDPATGLITGTPNALGQFVVGICVKEYRNGVFLGMIFRDFQFNVVDCTPTVIAAVDGTAGANPQEFIVTRCAEKVVQIKNKTALSNDLKTWEWVFDFGNGLVFDTNTWNLNLVLPDFGTFQGVLYLNRYGNCKDTAFVTVQAFPGVIADFDWKWDSCAITPIEFTDESVSGATGGVVKHDWKFGPTDLSAAQNPAWLPPNSDQYFVELVVTDADGCTDNQAAQVLWGPLVPPVLPELEPLSNCLPPGEITFNFLDSLDLVNTRIVWYFGDGTQLDSNLDVASHRYYQPGSYSISVLTENFYGCTATATFENRVTISPSPTADFEYTPRQPTNLENDVQFINRSDSTVVHWAWEFGQFGNSDYPDPTFFFPDTGLVAVQLIVENGPGCADTTAQLVDIQPKVRLYFPNAFNPHGNGLHGNEFFGPLGILPGSTNYSMQIFSRWGELVFKSEDWTEKWDGRRPGDSRFLLPGVYVFVVHFTGPRGEPFAFEGSVSLF